MSTQSSSSSASASGLIENRMISVIKATTAEAHTEKDSTYWKY
jgi:hypothetical protein